MTYRPKPRALTAIKCVVFGLALWPFARLLIGIQNNALGANPTEFITRSTGEWTLILLCVTLTVTPLRQLTGMAWLVNLRRMLGLFAFFYAALHFLTFIWFDHFFDLAAMLADIIKRPFITVGVVAFVLLLPLAITSSNRAIRALGSRRWQLLHRLIYVIAGVSLLHFWWMRSGKNDFAEPLLYIGIIGVLLGFRVITAWHRRQRNVQAS